MCYYIIWYNITYMDTHIDTDMYSRMSTVGRSQFWGPISHYGWCFILIAGWAGAPPSAEPSWITVNPYKALTHHGESFVIIGVHITSLWFSLMIIDQFVMVIAAQFDKIVVVNYGKLAVNWWFVSGSSWSSLANPPVLVGSTGWSPFQHWHQQPREFSGARRRRFFVPVASIKMA